MLFEKSFPATCLLVLAVAIILLIPSVVAAPDELIVNGGFETGDLSGWQTDFFDGGVDADEVHSGMYSLRMEGVDWIWQTFDPAVDTNGELTLWAKCILGYAGAGFVVMIQYEDDVEDYADPIVPYSFDGLFNQYSFEVDITKRVKKVQILTWEQTDPIFIDDVSLAEPFSEFTIADRVGRFEHRIDVPGVINHRVIRAVNILSYEIAYESVIVTGQLEDPTQEGSILLEIETESELLHYKITIYPVPSPVIPEVPFGTIMASVGMIIALVSYFAIPIFRKKQASIKQ